MVPTLAVLIAGVVYLRGWRLARQTRPGELPEWRALCFFGGLLVFWLSLASPLDALGQFLLSAHMAQHLALMSVAPPLLILGAPTVPLLRGLPRRLVREDVAPWMNSGLAHGLERLFKHPAFGWLLMNVSLLGWHIPAAYDLALRSNTWHEVEHATFFLASLPFWWFVLQPWPSRSRWSRWFVLPYLMSADIVNTALAAFLSFSSRVVYPAYAAVPRVADIDALHDQIAAGAGMWVIGSLFFLAPLMITTVQLLQTRRSRLARGLVQITPAGPVATSPPPFDVLRLPGVGRWLRARNGRLLLQAFSFTALAALIVEGIRGVQVSGLNLAGGLFWNLLRPLLFLALLLVGNLFCMACPFTFPRELARRLGAGNLRWPAWLRNKWLATALVVVFFWAYEQLSLWNSPAATAWLLLGYVALAFTIDMSFKGASFCKYVCPIGQFNFVSTTIAPLELRARTEAVCASCATHDCLRGNATQRGCELQLFMPTKVGNLDCTLCMDCVKACPHDNIELTALPVTRDLLSDPVRSSIGRLSTRKDFLALLLVVVFASLVNAGLMIEPVAQRLGWLEQQHPSLNGDLLTLLLSMAGSAALLFAGFGIARVLAPLTAEKHAGRLLGRFVMALVPLGLAVWAAHLFFHLAASTSAVGPTLGEAANTWRALLHLGGAHRGTLSGSDAMASSMPALNKPADIMLMPGAKGIDLLSLQVWLLNIGLLLSLYLGWRNLRQLAASVRGHVVLATAWCLCTVALYGVSLWVFTQPMQMRGMAM